MSSFVSRHILFATTKRTFVTVTAHHYGTKASNFYFLPRQLTYFCARNFGTTGKHSSTFLSLKFAEMPGQKPKGVHLSWGTTASEIPKMAESLMKEKKEILDKVGALKKDEVNRKTYLEPMMELTAAYTWKNNVITFLQHVSGDKDIREASVAADKILSEFDVAQSMRLDLFQALMAFRECSDYEKCSAEEKRMIERKIVYGKRDALHLDAELQGKIKDIKTQLSQLGIDFEKNISDADATLEFTREELDGCPDDFIDRLDKTDDGKLKVTIRYPHYFPCMKKAKNPETRRKLEFAFNRRAYENNPKVLEQLVKLRDARSSLLKYETHADFVLELRMAKTQATVAKFLEDLAVKLKPSWEKEMEMFKKYKAESCKEGNYENDGKINMWDLRFVTTMVEEKEYQVDHEELKKYFPVEKVTEGLLDIYQKLLGLKYEKVADADVWHPDVSCYSVTDVASNSLLGYFYLDLFPRDGKFSHAACFDLQDGCVLPSSSERQLSCAAMVANFSPPSPGKPTLMPHDEVDTFFHEFGHVMHHLCSETQTAFFAGTRVERDFVEAPSQMLENWCWRRESLALLSGHHETGAPIPDDLLEKLIASRKANAGIFNLRQIALASFDQAIHTKKDFGDDGLDAAKIFADLTAKFMGIESTANTNMPASFGHMGGGYDAQYYGYLWSEVYCYDMFESRFVKEGIMNPDTGMSYRKCILSVGGSRDAMDSLKEFLGREPSMDPFLRAKGLLADA